ncbi:MAG: ATP-binding protein [Burkholderiaceae bacterium]|nr:ATP-binding protein [Burkholderiaceae bacterium]
MKLSLIPAIFMFYGILSIAYSITLLFYFRQQKNRSIENCAIGAFLLGTAAILTIFRAEIPTLISYVGANALAYLAYRYFNYSLINLLGEQLHLKPSFLSNLTVFVAYSIALFAIGALFNPGYQTIFVCVAVAYLTCKGGYLSLKIFKKTNIDLIKVYGILFFFTAFLWLARILLVLLDITFLAFDANIINTIIFIAIFLLAIFRYMIFPIFLLKIAENEKEKLLIDSLVWANKTAATGALSASIAHELNQPLGAVQINSEFMKLQLATGRADEALLKDLAGKIVADNLRAGSIIQSLRSIFNSEHTSASPINIGDIVQSVLKITSPELTQRNINVKLHLDSQTIAFVNAPEIQQVILNILNNAMHAHSSVDRTDKEITIEAARQLDTVTLTITDNGPGIPIEQQSQLFELYANGKRTGMGLGLWLCKLIVTRNNGSIEYIHMPEGGAKFLVSLPIH